MYQREGKDLVSEIAQRIADADLVRERIAAIKSEICDLQDNMICPSCGEKISKNFEFCPICGTRQTKKSQESGGETTKACDEISRHKISVKPCILCSRGTRRGRRLRAYAQVRQRKIRFCDLGDIPMRVRP